MSDTNILPIDDCAVISGSCERDGATTVCENNSEVGGVCVATKPPRAKHNGAPAGNQKLAYVRRLFPYRCSADFGGCSWLRGFVYNANGGRCVRKRGLIGRGGGLNVDNVPMCLR